MTLAPTWVSRKPAGPFFDPVERIWKVSRYVDVAGILHDPEARVLDASEELERLGRRAKRPFDHTVHLFKGVLFFQNPPFHTRARNFLRQGLRLNASHFGAPAIVAIVRELLLPLRERSSFDAVEDLCRKLPATVMSRALGLAPDTNACLMAASDPLMRLWAAAQSLSRYAEGERIATAAEELLLRDIRRARQTGSGQLAGWVALSDREFQLQDHELGALLFFQFLAGIETTAAFLGNAIGVLMHYPEEIERLRQQPQRMAACVDELLRFAGPSRWMAYRVFSREITVAGVEIEAGAAIGCDIEAAHHDPDAYLQPERFDPDRRGPPALTFGAGIHACLGANLSRLEAATLLRELFAHFRLEMTQPALQWEDHPFLRRLTELPLRASLIQP